MIIKPLTKVFSLEKINDSKYVDAKFVGYMYGGGENIVSTSKV